MSKRDPTNTTILRRNFMRDMNRRKKQLQKMIQKFLVTEDAFGLLPGNRLEFNTMREYQFQTDAEKIKSFRSWLQNQVDVGFLEVDAMGEAWTNEYVHSAYRRGIVQGYTEVHKLKLSEKQDFYEGSKAEFLRSAFAAPETTRKLELLYTRTFDQLRGFTDQMGQDASRILATGLANGYSPQQMARELSANIDSLSRKRAMVIARTEVVYAHAEGTLDSYEKLGVERVGVQAEWSTALDDRVCDLCAPLEGVIMSVEEARGEIPRHPNCFISPKIPIFTLDGWKPIGQIKEGDKVLSHKGKFREVKALLRNERKNIGIVTFQIEIGGSNRSITVTEDHLIMTPEGWTEAKLLKQNGKVVWMLQNHSGEYLFESFSIKEVKHRTAKKVYTWNLSVDVDESYIAKGCVVHNCRCSWIPALEDVKEPGQKWTKEEKEEAIRKSKEAEKPKGER